MILAREDSTVTRPARLTPLMSAMQASTARLMQLSPLLLLSTTSVQWVTTAQRGPSHQCPVRSVTTSLTKEGQIVSLAKLGITVRAHWNQIPHHALHIITVLRVSLREYSEQCLAIIIGMLRDCSGGKGWGPGIGVRREPLSMHNTVRAQWNLHIITVQKVSIKEYSEQQLGLNWEC